jgi:hypothetical protein
MMLSSLWLNMMRSSLWLNMMRSSLWLNMMRSSLWLNMMRSSPHTPSRHCAGTDSDCGGFVGKYAQSALNKSYITMADIDTRLKMLFRVRMRLGHFDPAGPLYGTLRSLSTKPP